MQPGTIEYGGASTGVDGTDGRFYDQRFQANNNLQTPSLTTPLYTNHLFASANGLPIISGGGLAYLNIPTRGGLAGQSNANFCIEIDEFKFFKIIKNVLSRNMLRASSIYSQTDDLASLFSKMDDDFPTAENDTDEQIIASPKARNSLNTHNIKQKIQERTLEKRKNSEIKLSKIKSEHLRDKINQDDEESEESPLKIYL